MNLTKFTEKLNKLDGNIYTIEEVINTSNGIYEGELIHDNITSSSVNIYTGSKLTGEKINTYVLTTPSSTPWRTNIKIYSEVKTLYITYETTGDTVEAHDINYLQDSVTDTQNALNAEITRATNRENEIEKKLDNEISRATNAEKVITDNLNAEINRAKAKENEITQNLNNEITRATNRENTIENNLNSEITRAKGAENTLTTNLASEVNRATKAEQAITNTINTNKPIWDDKYTKNEIDNKISQVITDLDWKESVATYNDLSTSYPNPQDGWTVNVKDTDITYRWSGSSWIAISANSIPLVTSQVDGKMSKTDKVNLDDCNSKKHTHDNKSILDGITSVLINAWNSAYSHISDTIKHITSDERSLWNTVSNKLDKSGGTITGNIVKTGGGAGLIISKSSTSKTMMYASNIEGEHLFGGNNSGTDVVEDYVRVGKNLLQYTTGSNSYKVYHQGNKPTKSDVGLSNVDNTSDLNKPISTATQNALNEKLSLSGGTISGKLQNNSYITLGANEQDNHNKNNIKLYEGTNNNGIEYGIKLWNTNGTTGSWSTMIYGPQQANRRISFGKINTNTPTNNSHITEGAYFNLDNWDFNTKGSIYSNGNKVYHTGNKPKLSELTNDAGFITKSEVDVSQNHTHANKSVLDKITSSDVDKIQNLSVGGRNLFVNCGQYTKNNPLIIESSKTDGYNETHNIYTSIELTAGTYIMQAKTDGTWTNSHVTTGNDPSKKLVAFWLYRRVNGSATGHIMASMVGNPSKITITTAGTYYLRTNLYSDGTTNVNVKLWDIKLEKATIPTDWTPAPEDMVQKGMTWNELEGV